MEYIIILACIVMAYIGYVYKRDLFNPIFLFSVYWAVIIFFASLELRGENEASFHTFLIYFAGIVSFGLGVLFFEKWKPLLNETNTEPKLNYNLIYLVCIFIYAYSAIKFMRVIPLLAHGVNMGQIRKMYLTVGGSITPNAFDYFIDNTINKPLRLVVMAIASAEIARGNKNRFLIFSAIVFVLLSVITSGGRIVFLHLIIMVTAALILNKGKVFISKKIKMFIGSMCFIGAFIMVYLTILRQGNVNFFTALYANFTCNVPLMDLVVSKVQQSGDITYGLTFIRGFFEPISAILQHFGIVGNPQSFSILSKYTVPFFDIGGGIKANAYTSAFFYFYLDGRFIGVVLESAIYGMVCSYFYNNMKSSFNSKNVACYLLIIVTLFNTMIEFSFSMPTYVIAMILIPLVYKSRLLYLLKRKFRGEN